MSEGSPDVAPAERSIAWHVSAPFDPADVRDGVENALLEGRYRRQVGSYLDRSGARRGIDRSASPEQLDRTLSTLTDVAGYERLFRALVGR